MTDKHKPGPWRNFQDQTDIGSNYWRIRGGPEPDQAFEVHGYCGAENARLLAAAPELLSALRKMVATHPPCSKPIGAPGSAARKAQEEQEKSIANAKMVIAKVYGLEMKEDHE